MTGSLASTATLWNAETGKNLQSFQGHTGIVHSVALTRDGRRAVTGSMDGTTRLWDKVTGKELAALISIDDGKDWLVVTPSGFFDSSPNATKVLSYRVPGTLTFVLPEQYRKHFFKPGLLAALMEK
jgi:WD40 repeat protein